MQKNRNKISFFNYKGFVFFILLLSVSSSFAGEFPTRKSSLFAAVFSKTPKYKFPTVYDNGKFIKATTLGIDLNFNRDDLFLGPSIGLQTTKYNLGVNFGYNQRVKPKTVYITGEYNGIHGTIKLQEKRKMFYVEVEKRIGFYIDMVSFGILVGAKEYYSFGRYKFPADPLEKTFIFTPTYGLYWLNPNAIVKITYEKVDMGLEPNPNPSIWADWPAISDHRVLFTFIYCFNFKPTTGF